MSNQPTTNKKPIPTFSSIEDEAHFWDTHDTTDYAFRPVQAHVAKDLSQGLTVRFDGQTLAKLRSEAAKKGIGATTLIRMWTMERLSQSA